MAAEAIADPLFLDTSLIVAATVEAHPAHKAASSFVDARVAEARPMLVSLQVCREFLVVLTRQPVSGRVFTLTESLAALEVWLTGCQVLEETVMFSASACSWSNSSTCTASKCMTATSSPQCSRTAFGIWLPGMQRTSSATRA
jgi:uncharacterized protein with PIN domain